MSRALSSLESTKYSDVRLSEEDSFSMQGFRCDKVVIACHLVPEWLHQAKIRCIANIYDSAHKGIVR